MSKSRIDLTASKMSNLNQIQAFSQQLKITKNYQNANNNQLIQQNKKILDILKSIQTKIDKQLEVHKKNMLSTNPHHKVVFNKDQIKILEEKQANNNKLLAVLEKDLENINSRKKMYEQGHQDKVRFKKNTLQDKIAQAKIELKKLAQNEKQTQKKLKAHQHISEVDYLKEYARMQEQLRGYSAKYVKVVSRYNKITEQLALASQAQPEFQIPQQIYNNELDKKQQQQYKEYQSIVKLCTILSKRNDSQNNKNNRIYSERLKELQKTILNLTELQKSIALKETQILEGKKNIEMIRFKLRNQQSMDKQMFRVSEGSKKSFVELRQKSYSSVKLLGLNENEKNSNNKLRSRGMSFAKLPERIKI